MQYESASYDATVGFHFKIQDENQSAFLEMCVCVYNYTYNCILSIFTALISFSQSMLKLTTKPI